MKKKIFTSMFLIAVITAVFTTLLTTVVVFTDSSKEMHAATKMEAHYVIEAYYELGHVHLQGFADVTESRVTIIAPDGEVIFDSSADINEMNNHGERPEVLEAFRYGEGEHTRYSGTLSEETYYYAVLLEDGNIIRISNKTGTIYSALISTIPWMLGIAAVAVVVAAVFSNRQTRVIVEPINAIDLDDPDKRPNYSELDPLIQRLKYQRSQINEQFAVLERQNNMRREFTANVSHELKTPLTSISGYAEIIKTGIAKPQDIVRFAGNIYNETQRLIALVSDILKLSHLDEGVGSLAKEEIDLKAMCISVKNRLHNLAEKKQVGVGVAGDEIIFMGIRPMLEEMVYNLCDNAIKYNVPGGGVEIKLSDREECYVLSVRDTGIGIPEADLDRVFERFYRVDKSHSRETGGTGLGLSIVKHCALLHNGEISIESSVGKGTCITVKLNK